MISNMMILKQFHINDFTQINKNNFKNNIKIKQKVFLKDNFNNNYITIFS